MRSALNVIAKLFVAAVVVVGPVGFFFEHLPPLGCFTINWF